MEGSLCRPPRIRALLQPAFLSRNFRRMGIPAAAKQHGSEVHSHAPPVQFSIAIYTPAKNIFLGNSIGISQQVITPEIALRYQREAVKCHLDMEYENNPPQAYYE